MSDKIHMTDTGFYITPSLASKLQPVPRKQDNSGAEQLLMLAQRFYSPAVTKMYKAISHKPCLDKNFNFNEALRQLVLKTELKELVLPQQLSLYDVDSVKNRFIRSNLDYAAYGGRKVSLLTWRNYLSAETFHQTQILVKSKSINPFINAVDYFKGVDPILPMNYSKTTNPVDIFQAFVRHEGGCKELLTVLFCMVGQRDGAGESYDKTIQYTL